jgi:hypothetical protein
MQGETNQQTNSSDGSDNNSFDYHAQSHREAPVASSQRVDAGYDQSSIEVAADALDDAIVTWEASEYIHHQKDSNWYFAFAGAVVVLAGILYLLLEDIWSIIVLVLMGVAVGMYAGRKPEVLRYTIGHSGITIGDRHFDFDEFRSFSIQEDGAAQSIVLMPVRRFMPPVTIYFSPSDSEQIFGLLGQIMPQEDYQPDLIDRLIRNIRF